MERVKEIKEEVVEKGSKAIEKIGEVKGSAIEEGGQAVEKVKSSEAFEKVTEVKD